MIPAMLASKVLKKIVPKILDILIKTFPGLEKIDKLVSYMENPNEADVAIKELNKEHIILESKVKNQKNEINELKVELQKWKKNA